MWNHQIQLENLEITAGSVCSKSLELHELSQKKNNRKHVFHFFSIQRLIRLTIILINLQLDDKDTNLKHEFDIFFFWFVLKRFIIFN